MKNIFQNSLTVYEKLFIGGVYAFVLGSELVWHNISSSFVWHACNVPSGCSLEQMKYLDNVSGARDFIIGLGDAQILALLSVLILLIVRRMRINNVFLRWILILTSLCMLGVAVSAAITLANMGFMRRW